MQVTLPGPAGFETEFYVRVSSFDADLDFGTPDGTGDSQGRYELQIRLQSKDVVPGTTVQYADIRYAENGIKIYGPPSDSPLVGEQSEDESINDNFSESVRFSRSEEGFVVADNSPVNTEYPYEVSAQKSGQSADQSPRCHLGCWNLGRVRGCGLVSVRSFFTRLFHLQQHGVRRPHLRHRLRGWPEVGPTPRCRFIVNRGSDSVAFLPDFGNDGLELIYYGESSDLIGDQTSIAGDLVGGSYGSQDPYIGPVSFPSSC